MSVLIYHRMGHAESDSERRYCVSPELFAAHMRALAGAGERACPVTEFCAWLRGERALPEGSFVLTFDDGFLGVHEHAMPVLEELGWPATVFLVSGLVGGRNEWAPDDDLSRKRYPLLARPQILEMSRRGFAFQSHTRSHPDLTRLPADRLSEELSGSRRDLEDLVGEPAFCLAYPYGRYDDRVVDAVEAAGYQNAFSTESGFNRPAADPYRLRRLEVFGTDSAANLLRKLRLGSNDGSLAAAARYYAGRLGSRFGPKSPRSS
jgi:peptidoglycan/xylan/chitin deacetylase (PgdA/CDA1 family)